MNTLSAYRSEKTKIKALAAYDKILANWPVPYETQMLPTQFGTTFVLTSGSENAKPLVLLHGGGGNSSMWTYNIAELAKYFRVYAVDITGEAGKTEGQRPPYKTNEYALWLKEVFDGLNLNQAALCGASLGGMLAHRFALQFPEHVSALILLAPPSLVPMKVGMAFCGLFVTLLPTAYLAKKFLGYVSTRATSLPQAAIDAYIDQIRAYKPNFNPIPVITQKELSELPNKTLILIGDKEALFDPIKALERIQLEAPQVTAKIIPGASHTLSVDQADLINEMIIHFA